MPKKSVKAAPPKKAAKGTAASKKGPAKAPTKGAAKKESTALATRPSAISVMEKINAKYAKESPGRGPVVSLASAANCSYALRRPTGILSLDLKLAGGFPASAPSVIFGAEGVGKDYLLWRTCGETQQIYGEDFCMAVYLTEFKPDKGQMRMAGLRVAYSDEEIAEVEGIRAGRGDPPLTEEELAHMRDQVGTILIIAGVTAEDGFDALCDFLESNTCQIIAVNSVGFLQTEAKEATDSFSEFAQQRNEAMLLTKAFPKFAMLMNRLGTLNETAILLINQVRAKDGPPPRKRPGMPVTDKDKYKAAAQSNAMRHGLAIEVALWRGGMIWDDVEKKPVGKHVTWELSKGKLGTHDGPRGEYDYYYEGGIDIFEDAINVALGMEVITEPKTGWFHFKHEEHGFEIYGRPKVRKLLRDTRAVFEAVRVVCLQTAGVNFRYR